MTTLQAIILAVVEGLTEYLPVSSTGHIIIASSFMGIASDNFTKNFTVVVQFGAILSVLVLYWRRFLQGKEIYFKLFIAFLPAAAIGFFLKNKIDFLLDKPEVVGLSLVVGGVFLLFVDRWFAKQETELRQGNLGKIEQLDFRRAGIIGFCQCLAFIPGVSRSAATIVGALGVKLTREAAAEFSFLLAVPTLAVATGFKMLRISQEIQPGQISLLIIGNIISFIVGAITIKMFLSFLSRRGLYIFGVYRIIAGLVILGLLLSGRSLEV